MFLIVLIILCILIPGLLLLFTLIPGLGSLIVPTSGLLSPIDLIWVQFE